MKQEAIKKINTMGKAGRILSIIAKIFLILGTVVMFAFTVAFAFVPKELLTVKVDNAITIDMDLSSIGAATDEEVKQAQSELERSFTEEDLFANSSEYGITDVSLDNTGLSMNVTGKFGEFSLKSFLWFFLCLLIYLIMTIITVSFIRSLCKAFEHCESPFEDSIIRKMKALAYSLIPWVVLSNLVDVAASSFSTGAFTFHELTINVDTIFAVLIILALAYIFQYGAVLQKESDETL